MKLNNPFEDLAALRKRMGVAENKLQYDISVDPFAAIKINLEREGIEVSREDIVKVGPFLTYKGDVLAILYIYDSFYGYEDLITESVDKNAPKFHFTWCKTLDRMEAKGRFQRYILSRRKQNKFKVQAKEREPLKVQRYGKIHVMQNVTLYSCKNCLDELSYKGYSTREWSPDQKRNAVRDFNIQAFINENEGTVDTMRFYATQYSDNTVPLMDYTNDFPEISRRLREQANWKCSNTKCRVDMTQRKEGLHVHHLNGVKNDNKLENLAVLCALCHKNIDEFHHRMFVSKPVEEFILRNRPNR